MFLKSASLRPEYVVIKVEVQKGRYIPIGNIYRSPNSTLADNMRLRVQLVR